MPPYERIPKISAAVSRLIPKKEIPNILRLVGRSIDIANRIAPDKWGIRINRENLMLKVRFVEVLQVGSGWFHFLLKTLPPKLSKEKRLSLSKTPYKNAPDCDGGDANLSDAEYLYRELYKFHKSAIEIAARGPRHTTTKGNHSPEFVDYISRATGINLTQPWYCQNFHISEGLSSGKNIAKALRSKCSSIGMSAIRMRDVPVLIIMDLLVSFAETH